MPYPLFILPIFILYLLAVVLITVLETAVDSLSENKLEKSVDENSKKALCLLSLAENKEKYLSAFYAWKIMLIFSLGFLVYFFSARYLVFAFSAFVLYTFILILPKRLSLRHGEKTAFTFYRLIRFFYFLIFPLLAISNGIIFLILHALKIDPEKTDDEVTEETILDMIDDGEEDGNIETDEREMVENVFEFNNITAADIMVHRTEMTAIEIESSDEEIIQIINETGYSRFPVYSESIDNIVGILSSRVFFLNHISDSPKQLDEIVYEPFFAPEAVCADDLFKDMNKNKVHMAIILDEYGGTYGLVTMEDLLEIIVGNIYDETDDEVEDEEIIESGEQCWTISGTASLYDLEEETGYTLPEQYNDFSTVSGLVFSFFTSIPSDGETPEVDVGRLHIKVNEISEHRVTSAIVTLKKDKE